MDLKTELLRALTELAAVDREAYREVRAKAWDRVVRNHQNKTAGQLLDWSKNAS
jgi:hypothetical protein